MPEDEWLTVQEVAQRLRVTPQTVQRWLRAKTLPALHLGGKAGYRIRRRDLERFIHDRIEGETET